MKSGFVLLFAVGILWSSLEVFAEKKNRYVAVGIYQDVRTFITTIPSIKKYIIDPLMSRGYNVDLYIDLASRHEQKKEFHTQKFHILESLRYHGMLQFIYAFQIYKFNESKAFVDQLEEIVHRQKNPTGNPPHKIFRQYYMRDRLNLMIDKNINHVYQAKDEYELIILTRTDLIWGHDFWFDFDNNGGLWNNTANESFTYENTLKVWSSPFENYGGINDRFTIMTQSFFKLYSANFTQRLIKYVEHGGLIHSETIHALYLNNVTGSIKGFVNLCYGFLQHTCKFSDYGNTDCKNVNATPIVEQLKHYNFSKHTPCYGEHKINHF